MLAPPNRLLTAFGTALLALATCGKTQTLPTDEHWAFVPPTAAPPPTPATPADRDWCRGPIDNFVVARLRREGLRPSPVADRRTLIRRLCLDLTGLPPSRDEVHGFLADDSESSYEQLVDRLLASPQHGEHMARYWLDLVRFADTNGRHHDHYREMSPYRDWVIRAFRDNVPYDEFVIDQVAGDLRPSATVEQRIASGFHRLHLIIDRGTALPEESRAQNVIDRVTAFGTAFLGLTVHCAVCHDHKYDPITQREFFSLYAFFNNLDAAPETGSRGTSDFHRGLQPPYEELASAEQREQLAELDSQLAVTQQRLAAAKRKADKPLQEAAIQDTRQLREKRTALLRTIPAAMITRERQQVRPTHVFVRGAYDRPGERVNRATPAFLPPLEVAADTVPSRLDLARWTVAPSNPLTARAAVNRFWQQLFGTGLVKTSEDLGRQGERPSHPELLDHLTTSFVESGWNIRQLLKRIVMSATYRQASTASGGTFARDPENRLLARGSRFRLDAEVIRDQALATSGLLDRTMFGKSVKPPQPAGIWRAVTLPDSLPRTFVADQGGAAHRRSIYTFWKRGLAPPQLTILNAPTREYCTARRERTNTPLQALLLLNEPQQFNAARQLARETITGPARTTEERIQVLFETITARLPSPPEQATLRGALADLFVQYRNDSSLAAALCDGLHPPITVDVAELAAWTMVTSAIYNLDITKTRQ